MFNSNGYYRYGVENAWVLTVNITAPGQSYSLNIFSGTTINIRISWGDGNRTTHTTTGIASNTYSSPGVYKVKVRGTITNGNIRQNSAASFASAARVIATTPIRGITFNSSMNCSYTFQGCTNLTSVPANLFKYVTNCNAFTNTFAGCTGLTSIPTDLFKYNTIVSSLGFNGTFINCTSLTSIPAGLFDTNSNVSSSGFSGSFFG
jgi:hypothetical protein